MKKSLIILLAILNFGCAHQKKIVWVNDLNSLTVKNNNLQIVYPDWVLTLGDCSEWEFGIREDNVIVVREVKK